ncbi:hypothetical protein [Tsukamurella sp. PLM1]|uniref:hypothetical protein n=1 Tax=Tsukamurella sp. PLM1 TaxID=2929795 RepID=UPI0020C0472A|nr:hypothetical protein [Tsukamurella sp. PLM1]
MSAPHPLVARAEPAERMWHVGGPRDGDEQQCALSLHVQRTGGGVRAGRRRGERGHRGGPVGVGVGILVRNVLRAEPQQHRQGVPDGALRPGQLPVAPRLPEVADAPRGVVGGLPGTSPSQESGPSCPRPWACSGHSPVVPNTAARSRISWFSRSAGITPVLIQARSAPPWD